jgi:fatty-acyl-CoA synthase
MAKEGFDPAQISDAVFFDDVRAGAYVRLDEALYERIVSGEVRL